MIINYITGGSNETKIQYQSVVAFRIIHPGMFKRTLDGSVDRQYGT